VALSLGFLPAAVNCLSCPAKSRLSS